MKKTYPTLHHLLRGLAVGFAVCSALFTQTELAQAQQVYSQNFNTDDSANWSVNFSYTGGAAFNAVSNNLINFNFDYTTAGIPIAPHSAQFGSAAIHHGLKLSAVYTNTPTAKASAVTAGVSAAPTNFSITANFVMHADMWMNVNCAAYATLNTNNVLGGSYATSPHNGTASTVLYGCGYGTAGIRATTPGVTDAIFVGATTDNGSTAQMRIYGPTTTGGPGGAVNAQSSLQDFTYQSTGTIIPGFPGDPYVYNSISAAGAGGTRSWVGGTAAPPFNTATNLATGQSWAKYFPPTVVPLAQQILYPQQTNNASCPGLPTFAWHDVSVEKVGNIIIYKIDGNIIATGDYAVCGTPAGSYLTFMASRTGLTAASATTGNNYTNLNFVVFANVVVSNYDNVVNVTAPTPTCDESSPATPGVFTISRGSAGVPLTVSYTLTGTATNGQQYTTLPTTVTLASTATDTNINVFPINDGVPRATTTVILTLQSGVGYVGAGSAIVNILDGNTPTVDIASAANAQAYGRYTNSVGPGNNADFISYTLTRRGKLTTGSDLSVNLTYSGSAVSGTDFAPAGSVTILDGAQAATLQLSPLDNPAVSTNRIVTVTVGSGSGYAIGTGAASGTVVSAHYTAAPVLLNNDLTNPGDASNWAITYGCGDPENNSTDFSADFGMSLASAAGGIAIPAPPNGNANALHLTCNKLAGPSSPGAVNAYYTNLFLSGDYAVRFNMNIIEGQTTASATEGAVFGINHSGTKSNWWAGGGFVTNQTWTSDGIWYYVTAQPGGSSAQGDYAEYTGEGGTNNNAGWTRLNTKAASSFSGVYKVNPGAFTCFDGAGGGNQTSGQPANASPALGYDASTWSDVEIKQQNNLVTMSINHTVVFTYTNTTVWTSGYLMLGYADPFGTSIGSPEAGVYYANLQVVQLPSAPSVITINSIVISGANVVVTFTTSNAGDTASSFTLRSSGTVDGTYTDVSPAANIISLGGNQFQATTTYTGAAQQYYRVHHN